VHNTGSSTVAALLYSPGPSLSSQVTIYGWSTRAPEMGHTMVTLNYLFPLPRGQREHTVSCKDLVC
jgi:hypothetical protein